MNKTTLIRLASQRSGLTVAQQTKAVDAFLAMLTKHIGDKDEDGVEIADFGHFRLSTVREHSIRDVRTKQWVKVPQRQVVRFKAYSNFQVYAAKYLS